MKFYAVAVVTLAIVTECLTAERSRQRSGPIRSVPVAADIKRDVDFDCPEEFGYYPHPTDCTLYYVCVFGGALLESCTGGLMYSHELQTCDWPRNVGCDGSSSSSLTAQAAEEHEIERFKERDPPPPPPPPRRAPPPPPPRAQPNPVVTSRGQPKFNREEYEQQQQLYAEVDDLPPVEEIETDRQQRVNRGQPSTIGQVQKDRDGYSSQVVNSRTLNSNIIPASIPQSSGKIGSFSFGTQVDERRTATATQAPQTYSEDKLDSVTDSLHDRHFDTKTNEIDVNDITHTKKSLIRSKRDLTEHVNDKETNSTGTDKMSDRSSKDVVMEYIEVDPEHEDDIEDYLDDSERGKRQVRYYFKNAGYKSPGKVWQNSKPLKFVDLQQFNYNPNVQNLQQQNRYEPNVNQYTDATQKPYQTDNSYSTANPFLSYQSDSSQPERPFKASLPDFFSQRPHNPMNVATQIITKSPPISALVNNNNPFSALTGGFFNNNQETKHQNNIKQFSENSQSRPSYPVTFKLQDSSLLPSTVVTGKPVQILTSPRAPNNYRVNQVSSTMAPNKNNNDLSESVRVNPTQAYKRPADEDEDDEYEEDEDEEEESSEEDSDNNDEEDNFYKHDFPKPPYEFSHPSNKYAEIENPFENPNFDFDAFISKLRDDYNKAVGVTTSKPKVKQQNVAVKIINVESSTPKGQTSGHHPTTSSYNVMSTPRPFVSQPEGVAHHQSFSSTTSQPETKLQKLISASQHYQQNYGQTEQSQNENLFRNHQQNAAIPLDAIRPKLKPPNFKDERQLPITFTFNRPLLNTGKLNNDKPNGDKDGKQVISVSQSPYVFVTSTSSPMIISTPKHHFLIKPEKIITLQPQFYSTSKPYQVSSFKPLNAYITFKHSTPKPLTTVANEQLSALQHYWNNPSTEPNFYVQSSIKPTSVSEMSSLENLFAQAIKNAAKSQTKTANIANNVKDQVTTTTTKAPPKRRPIPKPSPEMNDYYYDEEDEQYYVEPPVKSKYMPSTEVKPQRPPMAQNYQEYDDDKDSEESPLNNKPLQTLYKRPTNTKPETATKNHNDVSAATKAPIKNSKYGNNKMPIPVFVEFGTSAPNIKMRPQYQIIHHSPHNRTVHLMKPSSGPHTLKPPKFLNQTTLRPYTVRHRLAKPLPIEHTTPSDMNKNTRGRPRHPNIVVQKLTSPRDSHNQETRYTKTMHDDKTNSLEPTESVTPSSFSASPRPKMLYNGSQSYSPDQYDPFYAVYDEDGELYKDTEYVQQYNTASLRPAVQQTYRGTPPPRRPVEAYTPRPTQEDYDDALIRGQVNNQNQYQSGIRHSTRGEGNELGLEHIPSSVKTTIYEAPSISTTPTISTTTQRSTTAPLTEAMTPSRYTPRSSTDESPKRDPESPSQNPYDGPAISPSSTPSPVINFSSLAKPFERTINTHRLKETETLTEKLATSSISPSVTNSNIKEKVAYPLSNQEERQVVSLTSGFSIRRNPSNANNPYTLTVISRPFDTYNKSRKLNHQFNNNKKTFYINENYSPGGLEESIEQKDEITYNIGRSESSMRRKDSSEEISEEELPLYVRPRVLQTPPKFRIKTAPTPPPSPTTKYYLKTVIKRPASFSSNSEPIHDDSTENNIHTEALIEAGLKNVRLSEHSNSEKNNSLIDVYPKFNDDKTRTPWVRPVEPSLDPLNSQRNFYDRDLELYEDFTTRTVSTTPITITTQKPREYVRQNARPDSVTPTKPAYYSYRVVDEEIPDQTTEVFNGAVKNIIKAFFNNFAPTPKPQPFYSTTPKIVASNENKVVNIGYQKKPPQFVDEKPLKSNAKRIQIVTEPNFNRFVSPSVETITYSGRDNPRVKDFSTTTTMKTTTTSSTTSIPLFVHPETTSKVEETSPYNYYYNNPSRDTIMSKFSNLMTERLENDAPTISKFQKIITEPPKSIDDQKNSHDDIDNDVTTQIKTSNIQPTVVNEHEREKQLKNNYDVIVTTTSTTKATTTTKVEPMTLTTKSLSFPTRPSRVNPAIKLAATNPGGGRRSYQSSSKCSSDNSLQANPKCNEIKYQRPTSNTRGRGSAHYSTLSGSDTPQQQTSNRGTPPTRSRPTLKPSTAVVTNTNPIVDIYAYPPRRPTPVYPQPTPDKTAAKCRKDVCLLPDCYCGGKDIPGDLPVESVPQIVLLTFDDSVNDLNKGLYADLFEKGRVNPNGCPISATFYVSHEWTDYSQVQNLYAAGHEMASHTISHSFGEQFSQKKWNREVAGQREILAAYGGVKLEDVRGMRAPFLSVGGNKMFKMLYDSNFTYDSSLPVYENRPPSWPYTLDYKLFHDCMIPPCPTKSYPGVWEVPMVMWQDLNGGRCSMGDACANPPEAENVYKMILKNFDRHYTTNRAPFGLYYHAAWFTQPHHKEGFIMFLDFINQMPDVWIVTNWQALQWVRDPTPISRLNNFQPFQCNYQDRPKKCNNPKVCNLWHKSGVRYMRTCQPCPDVYPWTGKTGIKSSRIDNDIGE